MDELARRLEMDPIEFRHRNVVRPGDAMTSLSAEPHDLEYGSYGLDQCLDMVREALARGNGADRQLRVYNANRDIVEVVREIANATEEIGRAHVCTPVTSGSRMPSSA